MTSLRVLMIGDVVGDPGLQALEKRLPGLIAGYGADLTVVNGENAAGGFGLTEETLDRILAAGADVVTGGNHIWEKREFWPILENTVFGGKPVLRPANYPAIALEDIPGGAEAGGGMAVPGTGWLQLERKGLTLIVMNLQGRELMPPIDCPFRCFDRVMENYSGAAAKYHPILSPEGAPAVPGLFPLVIVDFHAESTEEKEALAYYLDGRAAIVAGTHTHIQTADERILPRGTAYITDLGMTGAKNSVIGMDIEICLDRARTQIPRHLECAVPVPEENWLIQGIIVELDGENGGAVSISRISGPPP
ncbi:MAG: YmdB family metallophosphoesterase [Treponema sp.]|jgi:calcineurin-like phosphoesterase|nr:YmdB family metallophosphoesterase [Treponema sp.]